jgi:hypothetical protein
MAITACIYLIKTNKVSPPGGAAFLGLALASLAEYITQEDDSAPRVGAFT